MNAIFTEVHYNFDFRIKKHQVSEVNFGSFAFKFFSSKVCLQFKTLLYLIIIYDMNIHVYNQINPADLPAITFGKIT